MLNPGYGRTKNDQLCCMRDVQRWSGTDPPVFACDYAPDRTAGRPIARLSGFVGETLAKGRAMRLV